MTSPPINIPTPIENLLAQPPARHAAHENAWVGYYSTLADQPNYRYLFQVYINAVKVATLAVRPSVLQLVDGQYGTGYADLKPILASYCPSTYFVPPAAGARSDIAPWVEYQFKVGETYTGPSGEVCGTAVLETSSTKRAYNASRKYLNQVAGTYSAGLDRFQTARVSTDIKLSGSENFFMTVFGQNLAGYRITQYNASGAQLSQNDVNFTGDCIINMRNAAPGISASAARYTVQVRNGSGPVGDIFNFVLDCGNPKHPTRVVHFLNHLGGYDTAYFRGVARTRRTVERQRVQLQDQQFNASTYAMDRADSSRVLYGGATDYLAKYREPVTLATEFLADADYQFYAAMLNSTHILLEETLGGQTYFVPCTVAQDSVEYRRRAVDGLTALELELVPAHDNYSPLR